MESRKYIKTIQEFINQKILEEINTTNTYFDKKKNFLENVDREIKSMIDSITKELNIILPTEPYSRDFILIKQKVMSESLKNKIIQDYFEEFGNNKNLIDEFLLNHCSDKMTQKQNSQKTKLNITNLDFKLIDKKDNIETYQVIFPDDIKKYIIDNNSTNKLDYLIYINCESDNFNRLHFPGRIERLYRSHNKTFGKDEQPQPYKGKHGKWITDLFDGIPESLRGTGIGYAIYKEFLKFKGYLSSNSWSSSLSQSVWKKLSQDSQLFGILVNYKNQDGDILLFSKSYKGDYKKICDEFISKAKQGMLYRGDSSKFEVESIEIDDELKEKIK